EKEKRELWEGNKYFQGINDFFKSIEQESYKIQYRVMLSRYRGKTLCPECKGKRLRKDGNYRKIAGKSISEIVLSPAADAHELFKQLPDKLGKNEKETGRRLLLEITNRLKFLC